MSKPGNKWDLIKEFLWKYKVVIFIAVIVLIPILLNWLIQWQSFFEFVGKDTDWLMFWVTYISAIASFAMVFITWRTLQQNKEQLNELKRQWEEENRPRLEFYFVQDEIGHKGSRIEILNMGKQTAKDIRLYIDSKVIDLAPNDTIKDFLRNIGTDLPLPLLPNDSIIINLCEEKLDERYRTIYTIGQQTVDGSMYKAFYTNIQSMDKISITGEYNSKYKINSQISAKTRRGCHQNISDTINKAQTAIVLKLNDIAYREKTIKIKQGTNETK